MSPWSLPVSVTIGGKEYEIRSDYRAVLDILISQNDPELDSGAKAAVMLKIFYPAWKEIPPELLEEAVKKAVDFIDCGQKETEGGKKKPRLVDWEQDANLIIPAINSIAHTEIRSVPYMHWWTFFAYYMEIGESLFSNVVSIRAKKAKGKKLEKYEQEFYRENRDLIVLKAVDSDSKMEEEYLENWLKGEGVKNDGNK